MMKKVLRRRSVSHETVFNKATEIGQVASAEFEGKRIKELEGDKKQQGKYFDEMETWDEIMERIHMDLDGVKRMCRKVRDRLYRVYDKEKRREEVREIIMEYLHRGDVDSVLEYLDKLSKRFRSNSKQYHLKKLAGYIERNRDSIWYDEAQAVESLVYP
jgi:hypothetical protein